MTSSPIFASDRRIRLGIWGLGRGMSFFKTCADLNCDAVAGCDFNQHMRERFLQECPGAIATADADAFLALDLDAVLLATFCPNHADDAIRCLEAGKHVLSEVTAFHTLAEGVRLVEAVERSGKVYNLAENYPYTPVNRYLARKYQEGLFGDLMYAEFEYVHECRSLIYTYIDRVPVVPGDQVHHWRSWLQFHYYCTHSLGPVMAITGLRPTQVTALPAEQTLAGYLTTNRTGMGGICPSLITMSNGAVVRNLMGSTTNDSHLQRLWGTRGAAECNAGTKLSLRLGGAGGAPKLEVTPTLDDLGQRATATGHGGGDFWMIYYFARQILTGEVAPFDIYAASDVTIPGILAYRSSTEGGKVYDIPDFRDPAQREAHRDDHWAQSRYDVHAVFPANADRQVTQTFTTTMKELIRHATAYRAWADFTSIAGDLARPAELRPLAEKLLNDLDALRATYAQARCIIAASPDSDGARVLREMLEQGGDRDVDAPDLRARLQTLVSA